MEIEKVADTIYRVGSESSAKIYVVDLSAPSCTCPHWATSRNKLIGQARAQGKSDSTVTFKCKHVRAAELHSGDIVKSAHEKLEEQKAQIKAQYKKQSNKADLKSIMRELAGGGDE